MQNTTGISICFYTITFLLCVHPQELEMEPFEAKTCEEHKKKHSDFKNFLEKLNVHMINPLKICSVTRFES